MITVSDLERLGAEVRRAREARGYPSARSFAAAIGVSPQHLSHIERGYVNPKRGLIVPSDDVLDKIAGGADVPVSRLHAMLGRMPSQPFPALEDPDAADVAERYCRLPEYARKHLKAVLASVEGLVLERGE